MILQSQLLGPLKLIVLQQLVSIQHKVKKYDIYMLASLIQQLNNRELLNNHFLYLTSECP